MKRRVERERSRWAAGATGCGAEALAYAESPSFPPKRSRVRNIAIERLRTARALEWGVALLSAIALALAFPRAQQAWLAPVGAAGLFWVWQRLPAAKAFWAGWFAGVVFFGISFSWFTYTVGSYVGSLAFAVVIIPAAIEALAFGLSALGFHAALRWAPPWLAPAAGAAIFTVFEWLRSVDVTGVPFAQIGYTQTSTALGVFAAYIGSFGVTFVVMLLGAYAADAIVSRRLRACAIAFALLAIGWVASYAYWPARHAAPPTMMVAAVQGNIAQSIKWNKQTLPRSVARYTQLTLGLAPLHPQLIVWPETVITTNLDDLLPANAALNERFRALARQMNATLVVGSLDTHWGLEGLREYNALYTFAPSGMLFNIYDKRQLVPFAESMLAPALFSWLPDANLIGHFGHGTGDAIVQAGPMTFAPLICWESAFPDLIHAQIARGAQFLVISTDDAWFGASSGTFQHAQIAQMRAIESGQWVLQSASTGISGLIAPDGRWTQAIGVNKTGVVAGKIGLPPGSLFARIGPNAIATALALFYVAIVGLGIAWRNMPSTARRPVRDDA